MLFLVLANIIGYFSTGQNREEMNAQRAAHFDCAYIVNQINITYQSTKDIKSMQKKLRPKCTFLPDVRRSNCLSYVTDKISAVIEKLKTENTTNGVCDKLGVHLVGRDAKEKTMNLTDCISLVNLLNMQNEKTEPPTPSPETEKENGNPEEIDGFEPFRNFKYDKGQFQKIVIPEFEDLFKIHTSKCDSTNGAMKGHCEYLFRILFIEKIDTFNLQNNAENVCKELNQTSHVILA